MYVCTHCVCARVTCWNKSAFSQSLVGREVGNDDAVVTEVEICGHHLHSNCRVILNCSIVQWFLRLQPKYASNRCNNLQRRKEGVCARVGQWMLLSCLQYTVVNRPCGESNCCNGKRSTAAASTYVLSLVYASTPHSAVQYLLQKGSTTFRGNVS